MLLMGLRYGMPSKHGLKTTAPTTIRQMKWFRKTQNFNPGGRSSERKAMVT